MKVVFTNSAMALAIVAFLSLACTTQAQAPTTPLPTVQTASGNTGVVLNQTGAANTTLNGENGGGSGSGTYNVTDPVNASGNAVGTGTATGTNTGPVVSSNGTTINASGNAKSVVAAGASGTGATTNIGVSANASQGTWSGTTADPNATTFANASQGTTGGAVGTGSGNGTVSQNGTGSAKGESAAQTINVGNLNVTSTFKTTGQSVGAITATSTDPAATQQLSAVVSGNLAANGASLAGDPTSGTFGDASGAGAAAYKATSPTGTIQGAGQASGKTNAVINTNTANQASVSVASVFTSAATVKP